jgi:Carboxypeptidase regulatory-like domain/TonB dependent receptor
MSRHLRLASSLFALTLCCWAQFTSGFQGTVTDRSGAIVPGVTIRVLNVDTGVTREVTSSDSGVYVVPSLNPGTYRLEASRDGFVTAKQDALVLEPNLIRKVDFSLEVGNVHDVVDVSAQPTVLETETAHVVDQMNQATLAQMPVVNNNVFNLMVLQPGVTGRSMGVDDNTGRSTAAVNFAGARTDSNSYSMDDMSVNSISRGGASEASPNIEAVEQFAVQLSDANADEGRNMGAHVNIVTKAGTNQFHGALWDYLGNNDLDSRNFFSPQINPLHRNQFGAAAGGPIIKNRTFFYTTYEGIREAQTTPTTSTVETQAFEQWVVANRPNSIAATLLSDFPPTAYATTNLKDIGTPLAGTTPCGGCAAANQYSSTPLTNASGAQIPEIGTASWNQPSFLDSNEVTLRADHELRPGKDRMYVYWMHFSGVTQTPPIRDFERDNPTVQVFAHVDETHIFSPTVLNDFGVGMVRSQGTYTVPRNIWVSPISIGGGIGESFQDTNPYPGGWFATEYIIKDSVSIVRGRHTIKTGVERRRADNNTKHTASFIPNYTFTNILTFANDDALSESRTVNPLTGQPVVTIASQRITEVGAFVTDEWKIRTDLTVNLGLRYEYYGPYTDSQNRLSNFIYGPGSNLAAQVADGSAEKVPQSWNPNYLNFAPRIGLAWDIAGKGKNVIRAGYGIAYDRLATVELAGYRYNPPLVGLITAGTQYGTTFTYGLGNPNAVGSQYNPQNLGYPIDPAFAAGLNSQNGIIGERVQVIGVNNNLPQPYTQNYFFGYQRTLPFGMVAEANYLGSKGTHLFEISNVNEFDGDLLNGGVFHGYNQSFSQIYMANSNGTSDYNGLTVMLRKAYAHGLTFQGAYTWSKVMDESEAEQGVTYFQNEYNQREDRSLASFNVPQRFSINGFYNIPFLRNCPNWYCKVAGGWDLSALGVFEKGLPLDIYTSAVYPAGDWNADGTTYARPNAPLSPVQTKDFSEAQFLNGIVAASAFPTPALGTDGTLGRNAFEGPGFARVDSSLTKIFSLTERFKLRFRLEVDNTLNHTNLNPPTLAGGNTSANGFDLSSPSFGKVTTAAIPRQMVANLLLRF